MQSTNDYSKAQQSAQAYDKALALGGKLENPSTAADAYFSYGYHLQQTGDYNTALTYANKAIGLEPKSYEYYILLGEIQASLNNYSAAIATDKQAESLDDHKNAIVSSRIVADLAEAELAQGDKTDGMADIAKAKQIDPQAAFAYIYEYQYDRNVGNAPAALIPLGQLAQLQPTDAEWDLDMGNIYLSQNNVASAQQEFQKAQTIDPNNPNVQAGFAALAAMKGDTATVDTLMQKITTGADPKTAAQIEANIAIDLINSAQTAKGNNIQEAQKYADQATKADPTNGEAWFALGIAQAQGHDTDDAKTSLKKAYDIFKAAGAQDSMKQVADQYKSITGSDITSY
ncbi:MAG TPA: tetratricopeptide repeat protein, partial [Candidatus Eremiobacteraceae bacterium]|nr:tetratricopeptide repeat protein [Candidatus Eremiobacteraceae bacterium]